MDTFKDVEDWVSENNESGTGVDRLRKALAIGLFSGRNATIARAWLDEQENGDRRRLEAEQLDLERRATAAAESSAAAAIESANHARDSAKWAKVGAVIAVFALLVSAWPFIKDVGRSAPPSASTH